MQTVMLNHIIHSPKKTDEPFGGKITPNYKFEVSFSHCHSSCGLVTVSSGRL